VCLMLRTGYISVSSFDRLGLLAYSHFRINLNIFILQTVGRTLGRGIGPPKGSYLHRTT
jgi:hypothetical protein